MKKKLTSAAVDKFLAVSAKHFDQSDKYRHTLKEKKLFWYLMYKYQFKTDQQLADFLYTAQSIISQIRNDRIGLSHRLILTIYDKTDLTIEDIRRLVKEDI